MRKLIIFSLVAMTMCLGMQATCKAQEPTKQTQEPAVQTQEPAVQTQEPAKQTEEPTNQTEEPAMQTDEPAMQTDEPAMQTEEPAGEVQQAAQLEVSVASICRDVLDREPDGYGTSFPVSVGKLYCFTKITGAQSPTQITHVWFFDGNERARIDLAVNSSSWRTYSSKIIQPHELGTWRVDVLDSGGNVLKTLEFEVTP